MLNKSGEAYGSLIEEASNYFEMVEQMVEYQKYLVYNRILNERVNNERDVREFKKYISDNITELSRIE